jgi:hypothetical protein
VTNECRCGKPTSGAAICEKCDTTMGYAVANIAAYYEDLGTVATKRARYGTQGATKGSIGKAQPLPVDLRFVSGPPIAAHRGASIAPGTQLRWDTWNTVVAWCRTLMEEQPELHGPTCRTCLHVSCHVTKRRRWPHNTLRSMCLYLDRQHSWIAGQDWAPDMLDEMLDLERRLKRMIDRPADRWYAGKCSVPDEDGADCPTELYALEDRGWIDCPTCGIRHDVAERRDVLLDEAKDYLVTATEAAGALLAWTDYDGTEDKLVDRIRKWRDRGRLDVADVTSLHGRDRHLYRLGDIQALMIEAAQQRQAQIAERMDA